MIGYKAFLAFRTIFRSDKYTSDFPVFIEHKQVFLATCAKQENRLTAHFLNLTTKIQKRSHTYAATYKKMLLLWGCRHCETVAQRQDDIHLCTDSKSAELTCTITDTSDDIPQEYLDNAFSLLHAEDSLTLENRATELGLSICKAIIDGMGGEISLTSEPGKGTTATVWFPCRMRDMTKDVILD